MAKVTKHGADRRPPDAAGTLHGLLHGSLEVDEETPALLASFDPADARRAALDLLDSPRTTPMIEDLAMEVLALHGLDGVHARVEALVADGTRPLVTRSMLFTELVGERPDLAPSILARLDPDERLVLPFTALVVDATGELAGQGDLSGFEEILRASAEPVRARFVGLLVARARACGLPVAHVARWLLGAEGLDVRGQLVEALADEAGDAGLSVLAELADQGTDADRASAKAALALALERRTAGLGATAIDAEASVTHCDGSGMFALHVDFGAGDERGLARLVLRLPDEVIDGDFHPRVHRVARPNADAAEVLDTFFVKVPARQAAALAAPALTRARATADEQTVLAIDAVLGIAPAPLPVVAPAAAADPRAIEALLSPAPFAEWIFDDEDLESLPPPANASEHEAWRERAGPIVERTAKTRLVAMLRAEALLHACGGQASEAALFARAAVDAQAAFAASPVARVLLARTLKDPAR